MRTFVAIFAALLLFASVYSESIKIVSPQQKEIEQGGKLYLGKMGPGQTIYVAADPIVLTGGIHGIGGRFDQLMVDAVPDGWKGKNSKIYSNPLQAEITAGEMAQNGEYQVEASMVDEGDGEKIGGKVPFTIVVDVERDIMDMKVANPYIETGAGQPARYSISVYNRGDANDVFEISSEGVKGWAFKKSVYVPAGSSRDIVYEVVGNDEATYEINIKARSISSNLISAQQKVTLRVKSDLVSDYKATTHGVMLFPLVLEPVHAIAGLLSNLFN